MKHSALNCGWVLVLLLGATLMAKGQGVVINEIMYHPSSENVLEEWIELRNTTGTNIDVTGWRFTSGVDLVLSNVAAISAGNLTSRSTVVIPAGGYLVVAANVTNFHALYPSVVSNVVGNWTGTLNNHDQSLKLEDASGQTINSLRYADEGDWATRQRALADTQPGGNTHRGWTWYAPHDGFGPSLELINAAMPNDNGQNWSSGPTSGTPGRANNAATNNIAPLIYEVMHAPVVPHSTEMITITARVIDELSANVTVRLYYRLSVASPAAFSVTNMVDDGQHGDGAIGDKIFGAILPAFANLAVIEFYVEATDAAGNIRTWPAPAIAAPDLAGPTGQVVNALLQVDDSTLNAFGGSPAAPAVPHYQPVYKLIMTEAERAELQQIPSQSNNEGPNSKLNGTFITLDGAETLVRYNCGFRNRGHGSRSASPPNYGVDFPSDRRWKGVRQLNINAVNPVAQLFGAVLALKSGLPGADSRAVQVRVNGANRATSGGGGQNMYGSYACNEVLDADWASRRYPNDGKGNVYRMFRDVPPDDFDYRGSNYLSYANTYFKESNASENDWSDLIGMLNVLGTGNTVPYSADNAQQVADMDEWMLYLAVMAIYGNNETSPNLGNNDDYATYAGALDRRFRLLFYDLDSILGIGSQGTTATIFGSTNYPGSNDSGGVGRAFTRWLNDPVFLPRYYATLQRLLDTTFSATEFNALCDQTLGSYASGAATTMKTWMNSRRTYVQGLITGLVPPATNSAIATISGEPRSPTPFTTATLTMGGTNITHYRFKLNNGAYGAETPVATPITLAGLPNGSSNTIFVIGKNSGGIYQSTSSPTISIAWVVNTSLPAVRLNEILARNVAAVNNSGTFPDVIELYNEGGATVNLGGMRLTDDPANPGQFTFPVNTMLASGAYLLVYADSAATPGLHAGFSLNQDGDAVYLYNSVASGGALLDSVAFGLQLPDKSIGRLTSGGWVLTQPTFGSANIAQPLGNPRSLKVNEVQASGVVPYPDDFIEIYNPDSLPVALGGCYLTDEPIGAPLQHRITALSFIAGAGYRAFIADGNTSAGADHLNFSLSSEQGSVALSGADQVMINSLVYGPQRSGITYGRCPDGSINVVILTTPTPGAGNLCPSTPPAPITVTLLNYTNVWRYNSNNVEALNWKAPGFDDSSWLAGQGLLGNGGSPPEAVLTPLASPGRTSYYFRCTFNVPTNASISSLQITHIIDDGAVIYLNGLEAYRFNLSANPVFNSTFAFPTVSGTPPYQGPFAFAGTNLLVGTNWLAVEVHQGTPTSPDIFFGMKLDGIIATNNATSAGVVINEVLANNPPGGVNGGPNSDWVEFYNPSQSAVNLEDLSLSDSLLNPRRWVFPAGSVIPAQGYRLINFDGDLPSSSTNTGFGLNNNGDNVYLFKKLADGGTVLDFINFGLQIEQFTIGRIPNGGANWVLCVPTFGLANQSAVLGDVAQLKVNEWMANPSSGDDWFEIFNPNPQPAALGRLYLSDNPAVRTKHQIAALSFIGASSNAWTQFQADDNVAAGAEHVNFKLSATGEAILLSTTNGTQIDAVNFTNQTVGVSQGRLPDGSTNIVFFPETPTPKNANYLPLADVVVSEVLTHTDLPLEDAVELRNLSGQPINIGGWWLSDANDTLLKFRIPPGTILPPFGFKVFYEYQFNSPLNDLPFSFSSSKGDEVYLSQMDTNVQLTGYRAVAKFGPAANGVSFGRYANSQGAVDYVAMSALSLGTNVTAQSPTNQITIFRTGAGATNPYPKVGPVILNEVMYHPPDLIVPGVSTNDVTVEEFIELKNTGALTVPLYDPSYPTNGWRLRDAVDFTFTTAHSIPPGGHLIVVSFDPQTNAAALAQFRTKYGSNFTLAGPWSGKLDNSSDSVELVRPDPPQPDGSVPQILVEKVVYQDKSPWSTNADGLGQSLQRLSASGYANDVTNWLASVPAPGPFGDTDGDGMPDDWEMANGLNKNFAGDAGLDPDLDGMTNLQEYQAGTNPQSAASVLRLTATLNAGGVDLSFTAAAGRTYSILYADSMPSGGNWQWLTDVPSQGATGAFIVHDVSNQTGAQRYYRIVTPALP